MRRGKGTLAGEKVGKIVEEMRSAELRVRAPRSYALGMATPRIVHYRTNAAPDLGLSLGKKPGPAIAKRRVVPGYAVCFLGVTGILWAFAWSMPESTHQILLASPLFSAVYTLSVLGLIGFATLVFLRVTLLAGQSPVLRIESDRLRLGRPEGDLDVDVRQVRTEALRVGTEQGERTGVVLHFPNGEHVRIVASTEGERIEHDDPWDYTVEADELVELSRRLGRKAET